MPAPLTRKIPGIAQCRVFFRPVITQTCLTLLKKRGVGEGSALAYPVSDSFFSEVMPG